MSMTAVCSLKSGPAQMFSYSVNIREYTDHIQSCMTEECFTQKGSFKKYVTQKNSNFTPPPRTPHCNRLSHFL